ncbi:tetratricopeptide repeat protein [uncultured Algibacter sp.]|uniref:tetratricopeptide repeat protein n=1 Tax=uncultured Algibacter sp. TaxID=298659 RepID=UPI002638CE78|nr:tetratricopeptide repeat protein [uncultured Algibacter sp.]
MKRLLITLLTIIPLLSFGQAKKALRKAVRTTDLNDKIKLLNQVIAEEPKNLDAYFYRAIAKNDLGNYHGAIVDYSKIIIEEPDADTYFNRGNSRYSIKDFIGAKEDYAKAFILDENFIDALYSLACVKLDLEEYESAIKDFTSVIKQAPNNPKTYILRASAYKAIEQFKNALTDYSTAILIAPNANNYYNRGAFLMDIKYYQEANKDLTKSLRLNRNNAFGYFYRGASNLFLGKFNDAISDFNEAIKFDAMDFDAYLGLAMAHNKNNELVQAKIYFDRANSIIIPNKKLSSIEQYSNTFWFQNQYFYFNNSIISLAKMD